MLTDMLTSNLTVLLVFAIVVFMLCIMMRRPSGIPPGPGYALPFVGNMFQMKGSSREVFKRMRQEHGDIFSIYLGGKLTIVMNGYDILKEAFVKHGDVFSDRPRMFVSDIIGKNKGIIFTSGEVWREQRKFALGALRDLGVGRNVLEERVKDEVSALTESLKDENGSAFDPSRLLQTAVSNIICAVVFGKRFEYHDPTFVKCLQGMEENFRSMSATGILNFFPFLRFLPGDLFKFKRSKENAEMIEKEIVESSFKKHLQEFNENNINDFIDAYIKEMKAREKCGEKTSMDLENLKKNIGDFFVAGTESTATVIRWALLYFLHHPEIQEKCFSEIQEKIGNRMPSMKDKLDLPYVEATICEVLRHANVSPTAGAHSVPHDVMFRGYRFPEGVIILPSIDSVMRDSKVWNNPDIFRPERFLDKDGKVNKPAEFIPFFFGGRVCLGEALAKMELFLFLTGMIQRFKFVNVEGGATPPLEGVIGITHAPKPFELRAVLRQ